MPKIFCPTGLTLTVRKWNLSDVSRAAERQQEEERAIRGGVDRPAPSNLLIDMAQAAVLSVEDPGPYTLSTDGALDWLGVTNSDLISALILIRRLTKPLVETDPPCIYCRKLQPEGIEFDLAGIEFYPASEDGFTAIQTGKPFGLELETTEGKATLKIRPVLARDNTLMANLQREQPARTVEIANCMSIQEIQLPGRKIAGLPAIREFYARQDWEFADALDRAVEELFGGPDATTVFLCAHESCQREQRISLPLDMSFWGFSARRRKRPRTFSGTTSPRTATASSSSDSSTDTHKPPT